MKCFLQGRYLNDLRFYLYLFRNIARVSGIFSRWGEEYDEGRPHDALRLTARLYAYSDRDILQEVILRQ